MRLARQARDKMNSLPGPTDALEQHPMVGDDRVATVAHGRLLGAAEVVAFGAADGPADL
jgi:hypothetical protein